MRLLQDGVAALLERLSGVRVVGKTSLMQAPARAEQLSPDIVLFDATRPINLEYAKHLAGLTPSPKLVAFGVAETDAEIVELATIGIAGYARDDAAAEDVLAVLTSAMRGELLCSPRAAATLSHQVALLTRNGHAQPAVPLLSRRELQIADLIDRGFSNKHIARLLGIQVTTVKHHVHNLLEKLKVHRRSEAAACVRAVLRRQRARNRAVVLEAAPSSKRAVEL